MRKSNDIVSSNLAQNLASSLVQDLLAAVMFGTKPLGLEHSPDSLGYVEMRAVRRKEENIEASPFPPIDLPCHLSLAMNGCVVKHYKRRLCYLSGESIKIIGKHGTVYGFHGIEAKILTCRRHHAEDIEPLLLLYRNADILFGELPSVRHISACAYMALVSEPKVYIACSPKICKFLQLKDLKVDQLRRGSFPWAFPYTLISCAKTSKKRLKVDSLTCLLEEHSHASFAFLMLCRCFLTASFTAGVSFLLIRGFCPRPPFSRRPSRPSFSYRLNQSYTASLPYPTALQISGILALSAFIMTALHRMRNRWHEPKRYALSSAARASWLSIIFFVFPIVIAFLSIQWRI